MKGKSQSRNNPACELWTLKKKKWSHSQQQVYILLYVYIWRIKVTLFFIPILFRIFFIACYKRVYSLIYGHSCYPRCLLAFFLSHRCICVALQSRKKINFLLENAQMDFCECVKLKHQQFFLECFKARAIFIWNYNSHLTTSSLQ